MDRDVFGSRRLLFWLSVATPLDNCSETQCRLSSRFPGQLVGLVVVAVLMALACRKMMLGGLFKPRCRGHSVSVSRLCRPQPLGWKICASTVTV